MAGRGDASCIGEGASSPLDPGEASTVGWARILEGLPDRGLALVPDAVLIVDVHSREVVSANAAAETLYGLGSELLRGMTLDDLEAAAPLSRVSRASAVRDGDGGLSWHRHRDGTVFPVVSTSCGFTREGVELELCLVRDLSAWVDLHAALEQSRSLLLDKNLQLEQKNAALRELVEQVRTEGQRVGERVKSNVDLLVLPHLDRLRARLPARYKVDLDRLEVNLRDIASSFGEQVSALGARLSPREVEVCDHIRRGRSSKQIALALGLSVMSVAVHRRNIRRKLGLTRSQINLRTFLDHRKG